MQTTRGVRYRREQESEGVMRGERDHETRPQASSTELSAEAMSWSQGRREHRGEVGRRPSAVLQVNSV